VGESVTDRTTTFIAVFNGTLGVVLGVNAASNGELALAWNWGAAGLSWLTFAALRHYDSKRDSRKVTP
jgi:hypothetical protein